MSLEREIVKEERTLLFSECLYPYKILNNVRVKRTSLENEKKYLDEIQTRNLIHNKQMQMIYSPLRDVFIKTNIFKDRKKKIEDALSKDYNIRYTIFVF